MGIEVPEFKRCCCCVPLRYGLLAWGYLKLLTCVSLLVVVLVVNTRDFIIPGLFEMFILFVGLVDITFSIIFIVGAHTKNYKLLRVFYYATMVGVVAYFLVFLAYFLVQLVAINQRSLPAPEHIVAAFVEEVAEVCVNIALDCYLLLLTRSEILKLQRSCRFQFINNSVEAEIQYSLQADIPDLDVQGVAPDNYITITKTDKEIV